jgi:hypothetical protein
MSHNIDKILYINLDYRTDRKQQFENEMKNMGLMDKVERFPAFRAEYGLTGCGYSHLAALKIAKEKMYKNVLIFEDDFEFLVNKETFEKQLDMFFKTIDTFDVCMLSYKLPQYQDIGNECVYKVIEAGTASGYIVNSHFYDKLIKLYEDTIPLLETTRDCFKYANDQTWKLLQPESNWYAFKNRIGKQRASYSDNTRLYENYNL